MSKKVLIVDDDYAFSSFARRLLEDDGLEAVVAETGRAALDCARRLRPGLIILDLGLPDMDGVDVLKALKADASTSRIPVAVCSITRDSKDLRRTMTIGAAKILRKPLEPRVAMPEIKALLSAGEA